MQPKTRHLASQCVKDAPFGIWRITWSRHNGSASFAAHGCLFWGHNQPFLWSTTRSGSNLRAQCGDADAGCSASCRKMQELAGESRCRCSGSEACVNPLPSTEIPNGACCVRPSVRTSAPLTTALGRPEASRLEVVSTVAESSRVHVALSSQPSETWCCTPTFSSHAAAGRQTR
eukprot:558478-Prymnesium_polylepis.1